MNWAILERMAPILMRVGREIYEALKDGADDEEIRLRVASPKVILKDELARLREAEDDLENFIRTGK